jgi:hypothetical protein
VADDTLGVLDAVIAHLRADAGVAALVGSRVFDQPTPGGVFPYIAVGPVFGQPVEAHLLDGWECVMTLESWSRGFGGVEVRQIMAAVEAALNGAALSVAGRFFVYARLLDSRDQSERGGELRRGSQRFGIMTHE